MARRHRSSTCFEQLDEQFDVTSSAVLALEALDIREVFNEVVQVKALFHKEVVREK